MIFCNKTNVRCIQFISAAILLLTGGCSSLPKTPAGETVPPVAVAEGAFNDDAHSLTPIETSMIAAGKDHAKLATVENELLAIMQKPGADRLHVQEAAIHLGYVMQSGPSGPNPATLASLAPLLSNPDLVDFARLALERVPGKSVDALYLSALPPASGRVRLALMDGLATRGVAAAVPLLGAGINDPDPIIATASARALGRIGGSAALTALESAREPATPAVLNARLSIVSNMDSATAARTAGAIFNDAAAPLPQRSAALRSLINASPTKAVELIHNALISGVPAFHDVAIHAVNTLPATNTGAELVGRLETYSVDVQIGLIGALGARGDKGAITGLLKSLENSDAGVRLAAIEALGRLPGSPEVAGRLAKLSVGSRAEAKSAFASLARLNGPGLNDFIRTGAATPDELLQPLYIQQLAARNQTDAIPVLLQLRSSSVEELRLEALDALRAIASPGEENAIIAWALGTSSPTEQTRAVRALVTIILRDDQTESRTDQVLNAIAMGDTPARLILLPVLSRVPNPKTLTSAKTLALNVDDTMASAAVAELNRWPDGGALSALVDVAVQTPLPVVRIAAIQGAVRFITTNSDQPATQRSAQARTLIGLSSEVAHQKELLNVLSLCGDQPALKTARTYLANPATAEVARDAVDAITSNLKGPPVCQASNAGSDTAKLFDGRKDTYWSVQGTPGEWLLVDLHNSRPVRKLTLDQGDRGRNFPAKVEIFVSDDPAQPGSLQLAAEGTNDMTVITLPTGVRGRYLWIKQTGTRAGPWAIAELRVE